MRDLRAYKHLDHYVLVGKNTFHVKDKLRSLGGKAEKIGGTWYWHVSRETAEAVEADFQVRIRESAHCHMPEEITVVSHKDAVVGKVIPTSCPMCDSGWGCVKSTVLEVLGEAEWNR